MAYNSTPNSPGVHKILICNSTPALCTIQLAGIDRMKQKKSRGWRLGFYTSGIAVKNNTFNGKLQFFRIACAIMLLKFSCSVNWWRRCDCQSCTTPLPLRESGFLRWRGKYYFVSCCGDDCRDGKMLITSADYPNPQKIVFLMLPAPARRRFPTISRSAQ